ncbi:MAG: MerR family transcriptional regulator [PVC group bacterium]|nr:MerR family transcriptional regulator [PVC group bacterium]
MDDIMTAMDVVKEFNISYQTLNHYTNFGLLNAVKKRGLGNKRLYAASEVKNNLQRIDQLKEKGYPLKIIVEILKENHSVTV